jgi:hypothetical protein
VKWGEPLWLASHVKIKYFERKQTSHIIVSSFHIPQSKILQTFRNKPSNHLHKPSAQVPPEVNLTSNHLTMEQDNFHEVPIKLAGQPGRELVGTGSFQKKKTFWTITLLVLVK